MEEARRETDGTECLPVTHDSLRLVDQVKTIAEQRIYLDEANELFTLLTGKWIQALLEVGAMMLAFNIKNGICHLGP